jgi:hypothetical protein
MVRWFRSRADTSVTPKLIWNDKGSGAGGSVTVVGPPTTSGVGVVTDDAKAGEMALVMGEVGKVWPFTAVQGYDVENDLWRILGKSLDW